MSMHIQAVRRAPFNPTPPPETLTGLEIWLARGTNLGPYTYFAEDLGRYLVESDLEVISGGHSNDMMTDDGVIRRKWIDGNVILDTGGISFEECYVDGWITNSFNNRHFDLSYTTVANSGPASDYAVGTQDYTAYRCSFGGSSDGSKGQGNVVATECYFGTKAQSSSDHCDGFQNSTGNGDVTATRCAFNAYPENYDSIPGAPNGGFFWADGSNGQSFLTDCVFAGGAIPLRLHENGTHTVNGCYVVYNYGDTGWVGYTSFANAVAVNWATTAPNYGIDELGNILVELEGP